MFSGHGNKSLHHCSVVQQRFGRTHRKVHPLFTGNERNLSPVHLVIAGTVK